MAVHVTAVFVVPVTLAVNCCVPPVNIDAVLGVTEIDKTGAAVTVTVAVADFVLSAALVAVIV